MSTTHQNDLDERPNTASDVAVVTLDIDGQRVRASVRPGTTSRTPLLIFNGIGANLELLDPFRHALDEVTTIVFDIPGVGGSPSPRIPYRFFMLAKLADRVLLRLGFAGPIDVLGISWGGMLAQQFAFQFPRRCRRLVLAATGMGSAMIPASPSVLGKMASPRRYTDGEYLSKVGADIYGGSFRTRPELLDHHGKHIKAPSRSGYFFQLLASVGWSSLPWLWAIRQPTLVLAGDDDPIVPLINGRVMAKLLPHGQLRVVNDGHLFLVTHPEETAAIIDEFLT